jgi:hypothetical protein
MQRLERRWEQRQSGLEEATAQSTVTVGRPIVEVWQFITSPESTVVTGTNVVRSFRVPGTPQTPTVGEQQCTVYAEGGRLVAQISETVAADPPHRLVTRSATSPVDVLTVATLAELAEGSTELTLQVGLRVPSGSGSEVQQSLGAEMEALLERVRACMEAGITVPTYAPAAHGSPAVERT